MNSNHYALIWKRVSTRTLARARSEKKCRLVSQPRVSQPSLRFAFTLVELLVVIAIIGILIGLLFPALQNMREAGRRNRCQYNLMQLSLGLASYSLEHGVYPAGSINPTGPIKSLPSGYHHNWIGALLPMMDAKVVAENIDRSVGVYHSANDEVRRLAIPGMRCPSTSNVRDYTSSYAGVVSSGETPIDEDTDGMFRLNRPVSEFEISDGLTHTLFAGEHIVDFDSDLGWLSGTRSTLRNVGHAINAEREAIEEPGIRKLDPLYVGGFASHHPGGAHLLLGSGEVRFYSTSTDMRLMRQLANRSDGGLPVDWKTDEPLVTSQDLSPNPTPDNSAAKPTEDTTQDSTETSDAE